MKKMIAVAIVMLLALFARLAYLELDRGRQYADWSKKILLRQTPLLAPRGLILDRNGKVLANNRPIFEAYADREQVRSPQFEMWAKAFAADAEDLQDRWEESKKSPSYIPVLLKSDLSQDEVLAWRQGALDDALHHTGSWKGIDIRYRPSRFYTSSDEEEAFSHVLGYVRPASDSDLQTNASLIPDDLVGSLGVEETYDASLRGEDGELWKWVDAHGKEVAPKASADFAPGKIVATAGQDLTLSIDETLQTLAYKLFTDRSGALVALHLPDGEILSLVSSPGFKNNAFIGGIPRAYWKELLTDVRRPLLNRAIGGMYPPGSTYKIVTASAALEAGLIDRDTTNSCPGYFTFGNHRFGCWNKHGHGTVNLVQAIERSCDVYFYHVGLKLDVDTLQDMAQRLGFNGRSGLSLAAEKSGFIPSVEGLRKRYNHVWTKGDMLPIAIGQGFDSVTPLQEAVMIARTATNNAHLRPTLIKGQNDAVDFSPLLSDKAHATMKEGLKNVIYGAGGTAGRLRTLPFTLAGKTGTAQAGGTLGDHAWFVAYAPEDHPQIAIAVLVEHGGHGGAVSAPIAAEYLKKYFELYPLP